jgi:hypothetical protein
MRLNLQSTVAYHGAYCGYRIFVWATIASLDFVASLKLDHNVACRYFSCVLMPYLFLFSSCLLELDASIDELHLERGKR